MLTDAAWLARCDWRLRKLPFGELRDACDVGRAPLAAMTYEPRGDADTWARTRRVWAKLQGVTELLAVCVDEPELPLLLEYAAIDWRHKAPKLGRDVDAAAQVARQGLDLVRAFDVINACVLEHERGFLARPRVWLDLEGEVRIAFEPASRRDVPDGTRWPHLDERGLVWVAGSAFVQLVRDRRIKVPELARVVSRCFARDANTGFDSLRHLRGALEAVSHGSFPRRVTAKPAWLHAEVGLGLLALGRREAALEWFLRAHERDPSAALERCIRVAGGEVPKHKPPFQITREILSTHTIRPRFWPPIPARLGGDIAWADAVERGAQLEADRDFDAAVALYLNVRVDTDNQLAVDLALARCYLQLHRANRALEHAKLVLDLDANHVEAHATRTQALLLERRYGEALSAATAWTACAPTSAAAVYACGRAVLGLGHMAEARIAFARAAALAPNMLEAQLLGREVERFIASARAQAGTQAAVEIPSRYYDAFVAGDTAATIVVLRGSEHATDPVAQLLLASCLAFEHDFGDAIAICERIAAASPEHRSAARIAHARCLVELGRADDALALVDPSDDPDACDVRAFALERLGRTQEAAREHDKIAAIAARRSDIRVGSIG